SRTNAPLVSLCMSFLADGRKAAIQGRDIGASLAVLVKKSKAKSVEALRTHIETWCDKECTRLAAKQRDTQSTADKSRIVLSTTHKAKGLERDRVWMLSSTYMKRPGVEEKNLAYVAMTRAR